MVLITRTVFLFCAVLSASHSWGNDGANQKGLVNVSMIQLIADPDSYLGQTVIVSGWFGFYNLFPTKEHYEMKDMSSSVDMTEPTEEGEMTEACDSKYVRVTGKFVLVDFLPTITKITRVFDIKKGVYCWGSPPQ